MTIRENWSLPIPPQGFNKPVAIYYSDGSVSLEWTREPERDFASEHGLHVDIDWPFIEGTKHIRDGIPVKVLWGSIGILPIW